MMVLNFMIPCVFLMGLVAVEGGPTHVAPSLRKTQAYSAVEEAALKLSNALDRKNAAQIKVDAAINVMANAGHYIQYARLDNPGGKMEELEDKLVEISNANDNVELAKDALIEEQGSVGHLLDDVYAKMANMGKNIKQTKNDIANGQTEEFKKAIAEVVIEHFKKIAQLKPKS